MSSTYSGAGIELCSKRYVLGTISKPLELYPLWAVKDFEQRWDALNKGGTLWFAYKLNCWQNSTAFRWARWPFILRSLILCFIITLILLYQLHGQIIQMPYFLPLLDYKVVLLYICLTGLISHFSSDWGVRKNHQYCRTCINSFFISNVNIKWL